MTYKPELGLDQWLTPGEARAYLECNQPRLVFLRKEGHVRAERLPASTTHWRYWLADLHRIKEDGRKDSDRELSEVTIAHLLQVTPESVRDMITHRNRSDGHRPRLRGRTAEHVRQALMVEMRRDVLIEIKEHYEKVLHRAERRHEYRMNTARKLMCRRCLRKLEESNEQRRAKLRTTKPKRRSKKPAF